MQRLILIWYFDEARGEYQHNISQWVEIWRLLQAQHKILIIFHTLFICPCMPCMEAFHFLQSVMLMFVCCVCVLAARWFNTLT